MREACLRLLHRARELGDRAVAALDLVEQAALGGLERRERALVGERRRVGAEQEVEDVAGVADHRRAGVQQLVGAGGRAAT